MKLYIGNLDFGVTEGEIIELFSKDGGLAKGELIVDDRGRPRGFAFVTMKTHEAGVQAIQWLNNYVLKGRPMVVCEVEGAES